MNNNDRQLKLETQMYRRKTFGKETYCSHCWAKCNGCIMNAKQRSIQQACVRAECRETNIPFKIREFINPPSNKYRMYGLKKGEQYDI